MIGNDGYKTLDIVTALAADGGNAQEIRNELTQNGQDMRGVFHPLAHPIIAKDDRHAPATVFGAFVLAEAWVAQRWSFPGRTVRG